MDGFFFTNQGKSENPKYSADLVGGERAMTYYDETDIPFYYSLAATFAIGDRYFSSVLGPTFPNRDFLYGASSHGVTTDTPLSPPAFDKDDPSTDFVVFDELERRGIGWKIYSDGHEGILPLAQRAAIGTAIGSGLHGIGDRWTLLSNGRIVSIDDFYVDAAQGRLPPVAFIDSNLRGSLLTNDEHPPSDIQVGENFVAGVVRTLMGSPDWRKSVLFVTWDENGGIYDHVAPPKACPPGDARPVFASDEDKAYDAANPGSGFDRYGFRVPFIAVSPWVKPAYVSHEIYDHTSITRFIQTKFDLPALSARDANASPLLDLFDFSRPALATPAPLARSGWEQNPDLAQQRLDACKAKYDP
jgi:phospholipase C